MRQSYLSLQFSKVWANLPFYWKSTGQVTQLGSLLDFIHPVSSWAFWDSEIGSLLCTGDIWAHSDGFVGDRTNMPSLEVAAVWKLLSVWYLASWPLAAVGQLLQLQPETLGWEAPVVLSAILLSAFQSSQGTVSLPLHIGLAASATPESFSRHLRAPLGACTPRGAAE